MNDWHEAEQHAQRGRQLYEAGQWDRALTELRLAVQRDPYQADWHFGMGLILDAMSRYREAAQAFEHALELRGEDVELLMHLGVDLVRSGRHQRAITFLERAALREPDCESAYCYRIRAYAHLGQHDQAELMFYLARQIVDECPRCYDYLAESLAQRGKLYHAVWCWHQALRLQRGELEVHRKLADAHWQLGQQERARRELLAYLRHRPRDQGALMQLGRLLMAMRRHADAAERFRQVIALDPTCTEAQHRLGELALIIGHLDAAAYRLHRAEQLEPNRPGIQRLLAEIARRRGRPSECRHLLVQEGLRTQPSARHVLSLARMMLENHMTDPVVALLTPQLERCAAPGLIDPADRAAGLIYRGVAHLLAGRLSDGIRDCRASLQYAPGHSSALRNLVLANLEAGRWRRAAVWLRRARRQHAARPALRRLRWRIWRHRLAAWWQRVRRRRDTNSTPRAGALPLPGHDRSERPAQRSS